MNRIVRAIAGHGYTLCAVVDAVVAQSVAEAPEFLNNVGHVGITVLL